MDKPAAPKGVTVKPQMLQAGPIRVKFADGELRYLYVGNKEIVRRLYFAVRDDQWNTAMPQFSKISVHRQNDGFQIELAATCQTDKTDYHWTGQITGTPDGKITFHAEGEAGRDFGSNRIGLCLLYGTPSVVGQAFDVPDAKGEAKSGTFPALVTPTLVASQFQTLRYKTGDSLTVEAHSDGATFDMEDQRNYGDSSFKAYAPLPYPYPKVAQGAKLAQTLTIAVSNAPVGANQRGKENRTVRVTLGALQPNARIPRLVEPPAGATDEVFMSVNGSRDAQKDKKQIIWGYNPAVHLPDNDNFMDNATTIVDQAATTRNFAPGATLLVEPIRMGMGSPGHPRDARNGSAFGAAWAALTMKYFALAHVEEAGFDMSGFPYRILERLNAYVGQPTYAVAIEADGHAPIDAFAVDDSGKPILWLINLTEQPQSVAWESLTAGAAYRVRHANADSLSGLPPIDSVTVNPQGRIALKLQPYEVCEIRAAQ